MGEQGGSRTLENPMAAFAGEDPDAYPSMARTARDEGFIEIADWFETLAKAERSHAERSHAAKFTKAHETPTD